MAPGKGGDDKDNPLHFSSEIKDWPTLKEAIQSRVDARDTTWLLEGGRALSLLFARQIKDKCGTKATQQRALDREQAKTDSNHVPTSVDAYTDDALQA
jgi:3-polyprenyl-4-hydroxybenzoate decarboxylase